MQKSTLMNAVIRNMNISVFIMVIGVFFLFDTAPAHAFSVTIPEKLSYDLTWTGIKAGDATLEVLRDGELFMIRSTAHSADWVSLFYTVDDRIESILADQRSSGEFWLPASYRVKIREGKLRRDKEVTFDHKGKKAVYTDHLKKEIKDHEIGEMTFDPLSSFYFVRTLPRLDIGKSVYVTIFDSKKLWNVEVKVLRKEKITTGLGSFDTVVIKPLMQSEGIFYKKGDILIWLTDDLKRIPVKMTTKVAVGSITATLTGGQY